MIKPLNNMLLIKLFENENKTASGLIFKEAWETARNKAEVLEVGAEVTTLKKGDKVIINPYAMHDVSANVPGAQKEENFLIREKDVIALCQ